MLTQILLLSLFASYCNDCYFLLHCNTLFQMLSVQEVADQTAMARSLLSLAILACEEQNYAQALILLDQAHALGGDEEFWYQFILAKVRAVVGQTDRAAHIKV